MAYILPPLPPGLKPTRTPGQLDDVTASHFLKVLFTPDGFYTVRLATLGGRFVLSAWRSKEKAQNDLAIAVATIGPYPIGWLKIPQELQAAIAKYLDHGDAAGLANDDSAAYEVCATDELGRLVVDKGRETVRGLNRWRKRRAVSSSRPACRR
jgi:hypothetical protein